MKGAAASGFELGAVMASLGEVRTLGDGPAENCPESQPPFTMTQPLSKKCWRHLENTDVERPKRDRQDNALLWFNGIRLLWSVWAWSKRVKYWTS